MHTTSLTLLERLRQPQDQEAWARFVKLYTPLLYGWSRKAGLQDQDAADLVQDVLGLLVRKLPVFQYDRCGSFRAWLRKVTLNKWRERLRRTAGSELTNNDQLHTIPAPDLTAAFEETEYQRELVAGALRLIEPEVSPTTWKAFREHVVAGRDAAQVATELGISVGTVYAAKSRVLTQLRRHLRGLLE